MSVIDELGSRASRFMAEKNLFLLNQEEKLGEAVKFYHFFPYKYGPYSYMSYIDLGILMSKGVIDEQDRKLKLTPLGRSLSPKVDVVIKQKVAKTAKRFNSDHQIKLYVYDRYPWYTIKSNMPRMILPRESPGICTIGYEGKDIDLFLNELLENGIEVLVDVRYNPFSMNFSFIKNKLKQYVENIGVEYLHIPQLGIKGELRKNLGTKKDYEKLFVRYKETTLPKQKDALDKLITLGKEKRIALMCFEHSSEMCHRGAISDYLESNDIEVIHL